MTDKCRDHGGHSDCENEAAPKMHPCPYNEDINDDDSPVCRCCDDCAHECAMDI